jgi:hypothetical protein
MFYIIHGIGLVNFVVNSSGTENNYEAILAAVLKLIPFLQLEEVTDLFVLEISM